MKNLKQNILNKIKSGEVDMKPRWHFVLKSLLLIFTVLTAALIAVYLLSFILFALRQSGLGFVPLFGFRGISLFIMSAPWLLLILAGALLFVLQLLVHKYSFSYHRPLLYSVVGIIALVLLGAFVIGQTQLHHRLQGFAEGHRVPVFEPMYRNIREKRPDNIVIGKITELTENGFIVESDKGEIVGIIISSETRQRPSAAYSVSENVLIFGEREGDSFSAFGIREAPEDFDLNGFGKKNQKGSVLERQSNIQPEASEACLGQTAGSNCNFIGGQGEIIEGSCMVVPGGEVCAPSNSGPRGINHRGE